jgi:hypothetical protein
MIQRLGVPETSARAAIRMLDRTYPTFPKKEPLLGESALLARGATVVRRAIWRAGLDVGATRA